MTTPSRNCMGSLGVWAGGTRILKPKHHRFSDSIGAFFPGDESCLLLI